MKLLNNKPQKQPKLLGAKEDHELQLFYKICALSGPDDRHGFLQLKTKTYADDQGEVVVYDIAFR